MFSAPKSSKELPFEWIVKFSGNLHGQQGEVMNIL